MAKLKAYLRLIEYVNTFSSSVGYDSISIEIHFTTLYIAHVGTRADTLGEGAQAGKWGSFCGGERC